MMNEIIYICKPHLYLKIQQQVKIFSTETSVTISPIGKKNFNQDFLVIFKARFVLLSDLLVRSDQTEMMGSLRFLTVAIHTKAPFNLVLSRPYKPPSPPPHHHTQPFY